jgi:hypothetical protein
MKGVASTSKRQGCVWLKTVAFQDEQTMLRRPALRLGDQARFAQAGLARQQDALPLPGAGLFLQPHQGRRNALPAHHGRRENGLCELNRHAASTIHHA